MKSVASSYLYFGLPHLRETLTGRLPYKKQSTKNNIGNKIKKAGIGYNLQLLMLLI